MVPFDQLQTICDQLIEKISGLCCSIEFNNCCNGWDKDRGYDYFKYVKERIISRLDYMQTEGYKLDESIIVKFVGAINHAIDQLHGLKWQNSDKPLFDQALLKALAASFASIRRFGGTMQLNHNGVYLKTNLCHWLEVIVGTWDELFLLPMDAINIDCPKYPDSKNMHALLCSHIDQIILQYGNILKEKDQFP